jgi:hypothetical protein
MRNAKVPPFWSFLTGVQSPRSESGALLTLATAFVPVRVIRSQFVAPYTVRLASVPAAERFTPLTVYTAHDGFPMTRILARAVLARVPTWAARAVMARVINYFAGFERTNEMLEAEAVRGRSPAAPVGDHAVVLHVSACRPRPALIRATDIDLCKIEVQKTPATAPRGLCTLAACSEVMFRHGTIVAPSARAVKGVIRRHG